MEVLIFNCVAEEGAISPEDIELFKYVEKAEEAWEMIAKTDPVA